MSKEAKLIRGQVRQIVKEILPEVLKAELTVAILKDVMDRLTMSEKLIKQTLDEMNNRSKDIAAYVIKQTQALEPLAPLDKPKAE